jgi:hypothetical protein
MRTDQKHESVIAQMKGERKASNVVSQSKAVGVFTSFFLDASIAFFSFPSLIRDWLDQCPLSGCVAALGNRLGQTHN